MVTLEQMTEIFPHAKHDNLAKYHDALVAAMAEFEIDSPKRVAMFLAQCGHESGSFSAVNENLNYKAESLCKVFHKYFPDMDTANDYAKQPEKIANRVYGNRMGNGDEESGDGWRYHGRGLIQLTGRNNYDACGEALDVDLDEDADYLATPEGAARSAAWFWHKNGLNKFADADDIVGCTKRVNGGTIGLEDRTEHWKKALEVMEG
jgi:putative chitinase